MKKYRVILIVLSISILIITFIVFKYITYLRQQNNAMFANIERISKRITALEEDKTMEQVSALKAKNIVLKSEIEELRRELSKISKNMTQLPRRLIKQDIRKEKPLGNKGFLIKDSKPTH